MIADNAKKKKMQLKSYIEQEFQLLSNAELDTIRTIIEELKKYKRGSKSDS